MTTPRLGLPEMADGEGSGYVTFNELARILDAFLNIVLQSGTDTTPPVTPTEGDCWYVPAGATGAWAGNEKTLAQWYGGAWHFMPFTTGTYVFVDDTGTLMYINGNGDLSSA